jgi:hypothetical protein
MQRACTSCVFLRAILVAQLGAQSSPSVTIQWPDGDKPLLRLVFAGFARVGIVNEQGVYTSEVSAQNLSEQSMPRSISPTTPRQEF